MAFQTVFKRYELKYLLTEQQKQLIMELENIDAQSIPKKKKLFKK